MATGDPKNLAKLKDAYREWHDTKGKSVDSWMDLFAENVRLRSLAEGRAGGVQAQVPHLPGRHPGARQRRRDGPGDPVGVQCLWVPAAQMRQPCPCRLDVPGLQRTPDRAGLAGE